MFKTNSSHQRLLSILSFVALQVGVSLITVTQTVVAQSLPSNQKLPRQIPAPLPNSDLNPSDQISPEFNRYLLNTGDSISVVVQRPPGAYYLGIGDSIAVTVQRFSDLNFQAVINPEGNIVVPLLGSVFLKGLTLEAAREKIRIGLDRYVVQPKVSLALVGQRQDLSFQAVIPLDGNVLIPQVGKIPLKGLTIEQAQENIRLALSNVLPNPSVQVSLALPRPVQIIITGEVLRPGIYSANSSMPRITEILPLSGGTTLAADLRKVLIRRKLTDGSIISQNIDLYTALQNGNSPPNLRLQDGDAIIIPRRDVGNDSGYDRNLVAHSSLAVAQIKVRVLNYAAGGIITQTLPNGSNFLDALNGVSLDTANLHSVALVRFDPERGRAVTQKLDAKRALAGDISQNVALQDNDVVVVGRNLIGQLTNFLNTITQPFFNIQSFSNFFQNFGSGILGGSTTTK